MGSKHHLGLWRNLRQGASALGIVALTVLAMRVLVPRQAAAQPAQQGDVRATSFTLVGADGTVLGHLGPANNGNGILTVFDSTGRLGTRISVDAVSILDANGKARAQLIHSDAPFAHSGIYISDADGKVRQSAGYNEAAGVSFLEVLDGSGLIPGGACGQGRARLVNTPDGYAGLNVCDTSGSVIYTAP